VILELRQAAQQDAHALRLLLRAHRRYPRHAPLKDWGDLEQPAADEPLVDPDPDPDPRCGTPAGYSVHLRNHTPTCQACRDANAERFRNRRRNKDAA
jgi:hypothetical protein